MKLSDIIMNFKDRGRCVLSDRTILKYNKKGLLIEGELRPAQIQPNSIDLTLGNTWKKLTHNDKFNKRKVINPSKEIKYWEGTFKPCEPDTYYMDKVLGRNPKSYYILEPNEFILMASKEVLNIPNGILSFVQGRSSIARLGIQTEQAGLIDAGFRGTITFEVKNETNKPIILYEGMRVAQVYFFKSQYALCPYGSKNKSSKYQYQVEATGSKLYLDPELKK